MNKARISAMSMIICALCKVQQVAYTKLASAFDTAATPNSSLRRIQRLIAQCVLDTDFIAKLILKLIPVSGPYTLAIDRTNWKFSTTNINILTLGIVYEGMEFPVVSKMMDKRDNSNTEERIELIHRFLRLDGSGFNIENSHVRNLDRMSNLFAIIMIAYLYGVIILEYILTIILKR